MQRPHGTRVGPASAQQPAPTGNPPATDERGASGGSPGAKLLFFAVAVVVLAADRLTKWAVMRSLAEGASRSLLGSVVSLTHRHNTGAAFGLLPTWTMLLAAVAVIVIMVLLLYGASGLLRSRLLVAALGLQLGGAAGNLYDRLALGYVVDFVDLHFWPAFNVADAAITVGALIVAYFLIRGGEKGEGPPAPKDSAS